MGKYDSILIHDSKCVAAPLFFDFLGKKMK